MKFSRCLERRAAAVLTGCKNISTVRKISATELFAKDWQINLSTAPIDDVKFVGVRVHFLERANAPGENIFPAEIVRKIEDVSARVLMIRAKNTGGKLLRWEVPKDFRADTGGGLYVKIPRDKIILLSR